MATADQSRSITFIDQHLLDNLVQAGIYTIGKNYDYYFLKSMHEINKYQGTDIVIAGSSHAMNGIHEGIMEKRLGGQFLSFSISSQDLYYDFVNILHAIKNGQRKIKLAIINIGYYMIGQDVSLARNVGRQIVPEVYWPLFHDGHHYPGDPSDYLFLDEDDLRKRNVSAITVKALADDFARRYFLRQKTYYGELLLRTELNGVARQGIVWSTLSEEQKENIAVNRTASHNKFAHYYDSIAENQKLIREFVGDMYERHIKVMFVIFPFTKYYNHYIDPTYKQTILSCLEELPTAVEFLDMNDYSQEFCDEDFLDSDHLNDHGATKASGFLANYLKAYVL